MFGRSSAVPSGRRRVQGPEGHALGLLRPGQLARQRLTLNLGLRWDPYLAAYDRQGRVVCFQPGLQSTSVSQRAKRTHLRRRRCRCGLSDRPGRTRVDQSRTPVRACLPADGGWQDEPASRRRRISTRRAHRRQQRPVEHRAVWRDVHVERRRLGRSVRQQGPGRIHFQQNFGPTVPASDVQSLRPSTTSPTVARIGAFRRCSPTAFASNVSSSRTGCRRRLRRQQGHLHRWLAEENPAVYIPGAFTVGNTQQRRVYPNYGSIREASRATIRRTTRCS